MNKSTVILALVIGGIMAGIFALLVMPSKIKDNTQSKIENVINHAVSIDNIISEASADIQEHRTKTSESVAVRRVQIRESINNLSDDDLILSVDQFLRLWRKRAGD